MATGGQSLSSQEVFYYNCTPCSQQKRFIEAKRFCVECGEYFCSTCLSWHEKFSAIKGHTLVKCEEVSKEHVMTRLSKCELHTDKEEDMVCCDHDVVCCRVCIVKEHRLCQNIDYLPDLAHKCKEDGRCLEINKELREKIGEIKTIHENSITQAFKLSTRKTTCMKRLEIFQKSVSDFVETVVTKAEKDIQNQCGSDLCIMQEHIKKYSQLLSKLSCLSKDMSCENDDIANFKNLLDCKRTLKEIHIEPCTVGEKLTISKFQNTILESVTNSLKNDSFFGALVFVDFKNKISIPNLYVKEDDASSLVVIADFNGNKIRLVDRDFNETESIDVDGYIWGVCEISNHDIAFTVPDSMKVQFISTDKSLVLGTSFPTNLQCRGIAYNNEKIFVVGGGKALEERGQLNVFGLDGKLLLKSYEDLEGKYFSIPRNIVVNSEGIYITDQDNGIVCLDLEGKRKWVYSNEKCQFPWGISFTPKGNLLVCGSYSNNIVIVSKNGEFLGEVLNKDDGLSKPKALGLDIRNNRIIVSELNEPHLKVFYIGNCEI